MYRQQYVDDIVLRRPAVLENVQTNFAVVVNCMSCHPLSSTIRMEQVVHKLDRRHRFRVLLRKLDSQEKRSSLPRRIFWTIG